jgi:hypothetical protein
MVSGIDGANDEQSPALPLDVFVSPHFLTEVKK